MPASIQALKSPERISMSMPTLRNMAWAGCKEQNRPQESPWSVAAAGRPCRGCRRRRCRSAGFVQQRVGIVRIKGAGEGGKLIHAAGDHVGRQRRNADVADAGERGRVDDGLAVDGFDDRLASPACHRSAPWRCSSGSSALCRLWESTPRRSPQILEGRHIGFADAHHVGLRPPVRNASPVRGYRA